MGYHPQQRTRQTEIGCAVESLRKWEALEAELGVALYCLASKCTLEQLADAHTEALKLGCLEAEDQLAHLIASREGGR
jgi:hypothetical protein